jgi:hypothetical protein
MKEKEKGGDKMRAGKRKEREEDGQEKRLDGTRERGMEVM